MLRLNFREAEVYRRKVERVDLEKIQVPRVLIVGAPAHPAQVVAVEGQIQGTVLKVDPSV